MSGGIDVGLALMCYVVFVFSVVLHEAAHAWTALRLGDATAYRGGQVTLDPLPHIRREPVGMIVVPVLGFLAVGWMLGWASAPFNPFWARSYPRRAALMALAGPLSSLLLALVAAVPLKLGLATGVFQAPACPGLFAVATASGGWLDTVATLLGVTFSLNLVLFAFNLVPVPPLDGGAIVPLFLSDTVARRYLDIIYQPAFMIAGLAAAWWAFGSVFGPVHAFALDVLYG